MTLIELMIVMTIVALVAGVSYPSISSGIESLRLRSACDDVVGLLNTSLANADRRGQAVEIQIVPKDGTLIARSADAQFIRRVDISKPLMITDILPHIPSINPDDPRRIIVYPGGAPPRIGVEISMASGRKRTVTVDPITGVPLSQ